MLKKLETTQSAASTKRSEKIAIVMSQYHGDLTHSMKTACIEELLRLGITEKNIDVFSVPGSWEIPLLVQKAAKSGKYAGIATFGVIVKGQTYHFEMIANEVGNALMQLSLDYSLPIAMEVLAVYSLSQAKKRASGKNNKGTEAAQALVQVIDTLLR